MKNPPSSGPATLDDAEHGPEVALVAAALARRDDVADDGQGERHQATAAEALHGPERDQLGHRLLAQRRHISEPIRKMTMATWKICRRP